MEVSASNLSFVNCTEYVSNGNYDATGAATFIIITVVVYGLGIMAFIAGHIQKRRVNREEETAISRYLKSDNLSWLGKHKCDVNRTRSLLTSVSDPNFSNSTVPSLYLKGRDSLCTPDSSWDNAVINGKGSYKKVRFSISSGSTKEPLMREISKDSNDTQATISSYEDVFT